MPHSEQAASCTEISADSIEDAASRIAPSYDISRIWLFGSRARGEQRANSDVDLCLETGGEFSLLNAGSFVEEMQRALGVPIDITTEDTAYPHVLKTMKRDRELLYER